MFKYEINGVVRKHYSNSILVVRDFDGTVIDVNPNKDNLFRYMDDPSLTIRYENISDWQEGFLYPDPSKGVIGSTGE